MNMASDTIGGAVQDQKKFYKMQEMEEEEGARDSSPYTEQHLSNVIIRRE